jgi:dipeptidyl aminopeptidase/acylaminoacyl peptidase
MISNQIRYPVLLLHGGSDRRVTIADATRVFDSLPEPKQWLLFPSANGHGSLAADDGEQWRETVSRFLKGGNLKDE